MGLANSSSSICRLASMCHVSPSGQRKHCTKWRICSTRLLPSRMPLHGIDCRGRSRISRGLLPFSLVRSAAVPAGSPIALSCRLRPSLSAVLSASAVKMKLEVLRRLLCSEHILSRSLTQFQDGTRGSKTISSVQKSSSLRSLCPGTGHFSGAPPWT
jgi:hypothetical protein